MVYSLRHTQFVLLPSKDFVRQEFTKFRRALGIDLKTIDFDPASS